MAKFMGDLKLPPLPPVLDTTDRRGLASARVSDGTPPASIRDPKLERAAREVVQAGKAGMGKHYEHGRAEVDARVRDGSWGQSKPPEIQPIEATDSEADIGLTIVGAIVLVFGAIVVYILS